MEARSQLRHRPTLAGNNSSIVSAMKGFVNRAGRSSPQPLSDAKTALSFSGKPNSRGMAVLGAKSLRGVPRSELGPGSVEPMPFRKIAISGLSEAGMTVSSTI